MGRGRGKGSAWTPGFSGYRASWYTSVSGCVVRASMCAHFVHVWAGEGSDSPLEWGTGAAALRMRGECVCLHVSVCVRTRVCACMFVFVYTTEPESDTDGRLHGY